MASLALIGWPIVAIVLFSKLAFRNALIWSMLLAHLFLPEGVNFNFPGVPSLDKISIPALSALLCVVIFGAGAAKSRHDETRVDRGGIFRALIWVLGAGLLIAPLMTVLTNPEPIFPGGRFLPGLRLWDVVNIVFANVMLITPYFLARRYLHTPEAHRMLIKALLIAGLGYSLLALIEVRLSPQLNMWIYGYYQHSFVQHIRAGGFRPMVFLSHGLTVGFFLFTVILAAAALYKGSKPEGDRRYLLAGLWMTGVILVSQNLGATSLAFVFAPVILFLGSRWQVRIAAIVAIVFLAYPAVRQADLAPTDRITSMTAAISQDRANSFQFRLDNEDILLEKAQEKPLFGWGGWGRARVYNETGHDISVTDGIWIIILGDYGWVGYIAFFGFLTFPVIALWRLSKHRDIPYETAGMAVIMAGNFMYMIPNSTLTPIGWMTAGALAGYVQFAPARSGAAQTAAPEPEPRRSRYSRFGDRTSGPRFARQSRSI